VQERGKESRDRGHREKFTGAGAATKNQKLSNRDEETINKKRQLVKRSTKTRSARAQKIKERIKTRAKRMGRAKTSAGTHKKTITPRPKPGRYYEGPKRFNAKKGKKNAHQTPPCPEKHTKEERNLTAAHQKKSTRQKEAPDKRNRRGGNPQKEGNLITNHNGKTIKKESRGKEKRYRKIAGDPNI